MLDNMMQIFQILVLAIFLAWLMNSNSFAYFHQAQFIFITCGVQFFVGKRNVYSTFFNIFFFIFKQMIRALLSKQNIWSTLTHENHEEW